MGFPNGMFYLKSTTQASLGLFCEKREKKIVNVFCCLSNYGTLDGAGLNLVQILSKRGCL
jgi:hypothetical protein